MILSTISQGDTIAICIISAIFICLLLLGLYVHRTSPKLGKLKPVEEWPDPNPKIQCVEIPAVSERIEWLESHSRAWQAIHTEIYKSLQGNVEATAHLWENNETDGLGHALAAVKHAGAEITRLRQSEREAIGFATRMQREGINFAKLAGEQLKAISELPLGKSINESLAGAVKRVLAERDAAAASLKHIAFTYCGISIGENNTTLDMVPAFVEGAIDSQEERANKAEALVAEYKSIIQMFVDDRAVWLGVPRHVDLLERCRAALALTPAGMGSELERLREIHGRYEAAALGKDGAAIIENWHARGGLADVRRTIEVLSERDAFRTQIAALVKAGDKLALQIDSLYRSSGNHQTSGYVLAWDAAKQCVPTVFDLIQHLAAQREFSLATFGPGQSTASVLAHIRKELTEIEANPSDLVEWVDVVLLAFDGAMRNGGTPETVADTLATKFACNQTRQWPDWRTAPVDKPIEHVRTEGEATSVATERGQTKACMALGGIVCHEQAGVGLVVSAAEHNKVYADLQSTANQLRSELLELCYFVMPENQRSEANDQLPSWQAEQIRAYIYSLEKCRPSDT